MQESDWLDLSDQVVVVTGAASGIGAAVTDLLLASNAIVHTLDIAPVDAAVTQRVQCDLGQQNSIDVAVELLPSSIDMVLNCAGVPNGGRFSAAQVMAINWLGLRHLTEQLLDRIPAGGSITHVASTAGRAWADSIDQLTELMAAANFTDGAAWVDRNATIVGDGYAFSKQAVQYYTLWRSLEVLPQRGVRMNSVCPGVTNTQLVDDFRRGVGDDVIDRAVQVAGRFAEPREMAPALLFLADQRTASYVNGVNLNVDRGTGAAHQVGAF
jgi:NAD(P)-dependent dehydrogenase (short-subunit alcohol dehydrogenase family)